MDRKEQTNDIAMHPLLAENTVQDYGQDNFQTENETINDDEIRGVKVGGKRRKSCVLVIASVLFLLMIGGVIMIARGRVHGQRQLEEQLQAASEETSIEEPERKGKEQPSSYPVYTESFFEQKIDHFTFPDVPPTFQQRYLYTTAFWNGKGKLANGCKGPILFYTGNEGPITDFWTSNGFMLQTLAPAWNALVVFGEERYYGSSLPFGNFSFRPETIKYLTTSQVLADYVALITHVKNKFVGAAACPVIAFGGSYEKFLAACPVIAFGGSYGGTLTAYLRIKYPWVIAGGLAASAELLYYTSNLSASHLSEFTWIDIVNQVYSDATVPGYPNCLSLLIASFSTLTNLVSTQQGLAKIQSTFPLCQFLTDGASFLDFVSEALESLPQEDYPYVVGSMPAWPVNQTCKVFSPLDAKDTDDVLQGFGTVLGWYYGSPSPCWDLNMANPASTPGDGPALNAWGYQSCTETLHQFSARGWRTWVFNMSWADNICESMWRARPDVGWLEANFGGAEGIYSASNLIMSSGKLDPWSAFYDLVLDKTKLPVSVHWLTMPQGAHHLDLRGDNENDPKQVRETRQTEMDIIWGWIQDFVDNDLSRQHKNGKLKKKAWTQDLGLFNHLSKIIDLESMIKPLNRDLVLRFLILVPRLKSLTQDCHHIPRSVILSPRFVNID
eukprot:g79318.t1